jgi:hypothetical protein
LVLTIADGVLRLVWVQSHAVLWLSPHAWHVGPYPEESLWTWPTAFIDAHVPTMVMSSALALVAGSFLYAFLAASSGRPLVMEWATALGFSLPLDEVPSGLYDTLQWPLYVPGTARPSAAVRWFVWSQRLRATSLLKAAWSDMMSLISQGSGSRAMERIGTGLRLRQWRSLWSLQRCVSLDQRYPTPTADAYQAMLNVMKQRWLQGRYGGRLQAITAQCAASECLTQTAANQHLVLECVSQTSF